MTPRDRIAIILTCTVAFAIAAVVTGSVAAAAWHGHPIAREGMAAIVGEILIFVVGVVNGYVLGERKP